MKKPKLISVVLSILGVGMIAIAIMVQNNVEYSETKVKTKTEQVDIKKIATASRKERKEESSSKTTVILPSGEVVVEEKKEEQPPVEVQPQRIEVYEGMTIEELSAKLDRNLADLLAGKGNLIATKCLEKGVDPYMAVAIILLETGCGQGRCSSLVRSCNNVGGQKGYPSCSGSWKGYPTLDEGIIGFVDNLYNNYYARGLMTVESIGPRYAESSAWPAKVNSYINKIRAS